jgi:hypothetical protein
MKIVRLGLFILAVSSLVTVPRLAGGGPVTERSATRNAAVTPNGAAAATLGEQDKELLAEGLRLKQALGDEVWPGLGRALTPVILTNDAYDFLVGAEAAPSSPPWTQVDGDDFSGKAYYRRESADPGAPAIETGQGWVARLDTFERAAATSHPGLTTDLYAVLLCKAFFRSFQASEAPARFQTDMALLGSDSGEPVGDPTFAGDLTSEGGDLAAALGARERADAIVHVRAFLAARQKRRALASFPTAVAYYEQEMEWLLGLADYVAVRFYELAAAPRPSNSAFSGFKPGLPYWSGAFGALEKKLGSLKIPDAFALTGLAQARLLDRLSPGWRKDLFREGGPFEERLRALVEGP